MNWLQFPWRCRERSWTVSGPDLSNACIETEAILRALFSKHKFSNWHKTKWLFIRFSFMTNKQIKNSCVDFFNVLKFSRFIDQTLYKWNLSKFRAMNCGKCVYERALKLEFHSGLVICDSERKRQVKLLPHEVTFSRAPRREGEQVSLKILALHQALSWKHVTHKCDVIACSPSQIAS